MFFLTSMLIGGVTAGVVVLLWALLSTPECQACAAPLPRMRAPRSMRQLLWGGMTCPRCGLELDRHGKPLRDPRRD